MAFSNRYQTSYENWLNFMGNVVDSPRGLAWDEHLKYFKDIVTSILDTSFDLDQLGKSMYRQRQAGFYRWNILGGNTSESEFEAKFHVFPNQSKTHIHAHGYAGHSYVLSGKMHIVNFRPEQISNELQEMLKIFLTDAFKAAGNIQKIIFPDLLGEGLSLNDFMGNGAGNIVSEEAVNELWSTYGVRNIGAFQEMQERFTNNPELKGKIHDELFHVLVGESSEYSEDVGFLVHVVLGFESISEFSQYMFQGKYGYKMQVEENRIIGVGDTHSVGINQAHSVEILEQNTSTLFLTRKPIVSNIPSANEGEYHLLNRKDSSTQRFSDDIPEARSHIISRLRKIFSQN